MDPTAVSDRPRATVRVDGVDYDVREFHCDRRLDGLDEATIVIDPAGFPDPAQWLEGRARLHWWIEGHSGDAEGAVAGDIVHVEQQHLETHARTTFTLRSRLARLAFARSLRVFRRLTLPTLIDHLLEVHGLGSGDRRFALGGFYPVRDWVLQADETDLDFLRRQLAAVGVFTFFEVVDGRDVVVFADRNHAGGMHDGPPIRHRPETGIERAAGDADALRLHESVRPPNTAWHVRGSAPPERPFARPGDTLGAVHHTPAAADATEAALAARRGDEAGAARSYGLTLGGVLPGLRPGVSMALSADEDAAGDWLVTRAHTRLRAETPDGGQTPSALRTEAEGIPLATPWRPPIPVAPELPSVFIARIEADISASALLDATGAYRARLDGDAIDHAYTRASPGLRARMPYASPTGADPAGWHFGLRDGAEVLLSCLDGDPDRPCLIGFAPTTEQPGPVTSANAADNVLRTPGGNHLMLRDWKNTEAVVLETFDGTAILRLDARGGDERVLLACANGAMLHRARRDRLAKAGNNLTERAGGERSEQVSKDHRTETREGSVRHQANAGSGDVGAREALITDSDGNTEWIAGERLTVDVEDNAGVTVDGADGMQFRVANGEIHCEAAKAIEITGEGGGDIVFEQNGAGFSVLADGTVRLFGNQVSINARDGDVKFDGPVEYEVPAEPEPDTAPECAPPEIPAAVDVADASCEVVYRTDTQELLVLETPEDIEYLLAAAEELDAPIREMHTAAHAECTTPEEFAEKKAAVGRTLKPVVSGPQENELTEIRRLRGGKWIYIRSDRMRDHWRGYSLRIDDRERSLRDSNGQFDRRKLRERFTQTAGTIKASIKEKVDGDLTDILPERELLEGFERLIDDLEKTAKIDASDEPERRIDFRADARLLRYYAGASLGGSFDPFNGKIGVNANLNATASLAEGRMQANGYWPSAEGWSLRFEYDGKTWDLGPVRGRVILTGSGFVGASAYGSIAIEMTPSEGELAFKGSDETDLSARQRTDFQPGGAGAGVFAGAKAEGKVAGAIEWDNPEERTAPDTPKWKPFAKCGYGAGAAAGLGASAEFEIGYEGGRFIIRAKAGVVFGIGASGELAGYVDAEHIGDFIALLAHEVKDYGFEHLDFVEPTAFRLASDLAAYLIASGTAMHEVTEGLVNQAEDLWLTWVRSVDWTPNEETRQITARVLENADWLRLTPPETKARILAVLTQRYWSSFEEEQEKAVIRVLETIQTRRDFIEVCEHITLTGEKIDASDPKRAGEERILDLLDFGEQRRYHEIMRRLERGEGEGMYPDDAQVRSPKNAPRQPMAKTQLPAGSTLSERTL